MKQHVREFFRVGPARQDHVVGLRCAASVGLPLLTLLAMGRFDLMVFAAFGAFTGIYGRGEPHGARLRHQGQFGVLILLVMLGGYMTSKADAGPWGIVFGTTVVAGCGRWRSTTSTCGPQASSSSRSAMPPSAPFPPRRRSGRPC